MTPAENSLGKVKTWVKSHWQFRPKVGQFTVQLNNLKYLAAAVSTGNFGRAAKFLGVETSTISRHIARLEDELGLALFERAN